MPDWLMIRLPMITTALFVFAIGACVGSLINVLVYRLPRGLDVVKPTSRCPSCGTRLTWRENIPILGWIFLGGKCRFCKSRISPEYPIVESIVAFIFVGIYILWYIVPPDATLMGIPFGSIAPEWAHNGAGRTWPAFVVLLMLLGSLVAMTIIDARTCTIPLVLTWVPAGVALLFHTGHAVWFQARFGDIQQTLPGMWTGEGIRRWFTAPGETWTLATGGPSGWRFIGAALGGILGLSLSNLLLTTGLITRSFSDFESWERSLQPETPEPAQPPEGSDPEATIPSPPESPESGGSPTDLWIQYPHARREMVKELAFLAPTVLGLMGGGWLSVRLVGHFAGAWQVGIDGRAVPPVDAPLWLVVLAGVLMGYLIGGGVVWAVRIFGSLAFGKEAMGLGDVHMMAAVGACLGWIDPVLAFFGAAFVGVAWAILARIVGGKFNRAMPYGPFLAVATVLVILFKPAVELGLGRLFSYNGPLNLP